MGPYGLKGEVKIRSFSGETAHFKALAGKTVELRKDGVTKKIEIVAASEYGKQALVRFAGFESPESIHPLIGWEIWVDHGSGAPLGRGEYYVADLVGCTLRFQGKDIARICSVWESSVCDMLDVEVIDGGGRFNVPFQDQYIGAVSTTEGWVELLVDWILG